MIKKNYSDTLNRIISILESSSEWKEIEYIFIDNKLNINSKLFKRLSENKIIIRQEDNDKLNMCDNNDENISTTLNFIPTADLIIISNNIPTNGKIIEKIIDKHTIISKVLSNDIYYITNFTNDIHIFITKNHMYIFKGHGIDMTLLKRNEMRNT